MVLNLFLREAVSRIENSELSHVLRRCWFPRRTNPKALSADWLPSYI